MSCGQMMAPPSPAESPMLTWRSPMRASSAAMMMSQKSATVAPSPTASPFMPADHRLLQVEQAEDDLLRLDGNLVEDGDVVDRALQPVHIAAGAERAARAGEHDDVGLVIGGDVVEEPRHLAVHGGAHGVEHVRPVQRHGEHPALARKRHRGVRVVAPHARLPWCTPGRGCQPASANAMRPAGTETTGDGDCRTMRARRELSRVGRRLSNAVLLRCHKIVDNRRLF